MKKKSRGSLKKIGLKFEVIRSGRRFKSIDTRMLRDFINGFVDEDALIMVNRKMSLKEEREFQKSKAREISANNTVFVLCWSGGELVGDCEAVKGRFKESHNAMFGLIVKKGFRRIGIGAKLLSIAMKEAKKTLKARNLWIDHIDGNQPARKLYEKLGFRKVARLKDYVRHKGRFRDRIKMRYTK